MRALITGSAGFIGRHVAAELARRGWGVAGCDLTEGLDAFDIFSDPDLTDRFDLVVHAAAAAPHRSAIDTQPATSVYNAALDAAMFDWAIRSRQHRVLYLSSCAVYPACVQRPCEVGFVEELVELDYPQPCDDYAFTKLAGERLAAAARRAGLAVTVVRPFSGYGPDQGIDWPFGAFLARARAHADPFELWGDGSQVRDWIHVDDIVAGALAVVDAEVAEPVNLCTGTGTAMADLVALMCEQVGYRPELELHLERPAGAAYRVGDPDRMGQYYKPSIDLREGIRLALA